MNRSLSRALLLPTLPVVAAVLGACDDGTGPRDHLVEGVNLTTLFAEPTPAERQAILDDWAARDPAASDVRVEMSLERRAGGVPATLRVLSVVTDGNRHLIQPLRRGELTIDDVRPELIRRSAVLFADRLPPTQVHHGRQDPIVLVSQAESLIDAMEVLGRTAPEFEGFIYPDGTHNPLSLPGAIERTRGALERVVPAAGGV